MKASEILTLAKAKIQDPANWVKERYATNKYGETVNSCDTEASCFCSKGAMLNISRHIPIADVDLAAEWLSVAASEFPDKARASYSIIVFNDRPETTHEDVMKVWDLAIELAKEAEK